MKLQKPAYQLRLYRLQPPSEASIQDTLSNTDTFWMHALGSFDIMTVDTVTSFSNLRHPFGFENELLGWAELLCFSSTTYNSDLKDWLSAEPVAVIVLVKLRPKNPMDEITCLADEKEVTQALQKFPNTWILHSLGWHELVVFLRGKDLNELLLRVTQFRRELSEQILDTLSIPLFSDNKDSFAELRRPIHPMISVECQPGGEGAATRIWRKFGQVENIYEQRDLLIIGKEIPQGQFFSQLLECRKAGGAITYDTTTVLRTPATEPVEEVGGLKSPEAIQKLATKWASRIATAANKGKQQGLETAYPVASMATSLVQFYSLGVIGIEQIAALQLLAEDLEELLEAPETGRNEMYWRDSCLRQADNLALSMYQRSGQFGGCLHAGDYGSGVFIFLPTQARIVAAATASPLFLVQESCQTGAVLPFCVVFGASYSPAHIEKALSYPLDAAMQPGKQWWRINHEVGHAYYDLHRISDKIPQEIFEYPNPRKPQMLPFEKESLFAELFAQWYDLLCCFSSDLEFYLKSIWEVWLLIPRIWEFREMYLARSLLLFLYKEVDSWVAKMDKRENSLKFLTKKMEKLLNLLFQVEGFETFWREPKPRIDDVVEMVDAVGPAILMPLRDLEKEILSKYKVPPPKQLEDEVSKICKGEILDTIINPARLVTECFKRTCNDGGNWSIISDGALIFSLWNWVNQQ